MNIGYILFSSLVAFGIVGYLVEAGVLLANYMSPFLPLVAFFGKMFDGLMTLNFYYKYGSDIFSRYETNPLYVYLGKYGGAYIILVMLATASLFALMAYSSNKYIKIAGVAMGIISFMFGLSWVIF